MRSTLLLAIFFKTVNLFSQDTLFTISFENESFDPNVFIDADQYSPRIIKNVFKESTLELDFPRGKEGAFNLTLELDTTFNNSYDSIIAVPWGGSGVPHYDGNTLSYTRFPTDDFQYSNTFTTEPSLNWGYYWESTKVCSNCSEIKTPTTITVLTSGLDYISFKNFRESFSTQEYYPNASSHDFYLYEFKTNPNEEIRLIEDFCQLVSSNLNRSEPNLQIENDCYSSNINIRPQINDFWFSGQLVKILLIGYGNTVLSTEQNIGEKNKTIHTIFDLTGRLNVQTINTIVFIIFDDGSKTKGFYDENGVLHY